MRAPDRGAAGRTVAGLALAGGRSTRFGAEKAMAELRGSPLLAWSLAALEARCAAVAVSAAPGGGAEALARQTGRPVLHDDPGRPRGPLAGLAEGLAWAAREGFEILVTLPCDTPLVTPVHLETLIAALIDAPNAAGAAYAMTAEGPQPLCAAWRVALGPSLRACLDGGDHPATRAFLKQALAREVMFGEPLAFRNINTRRDLEALTASPPA